MQLTVGKILNKDLAEWMGVTANTFNKSKDKYLEELKLFAVYHLEGKKVVIDEVLNPVYSKQGSKNYQLVKKEVDKVWSKDGLDSCSRVGLRIEDKLKGSVELSHNTIYNYTRQSRDELYGKPFQEAGKLGSCKYLWCKKEGEGIDTEYRLLNEEEEEIKQNLIKKYFGDATEKQIIVQGMVELGEIKKEEAWDVLQELTGMHGNNFMAFLNELQVKIGCQVIRGTMVDRTDRMIEFKD